MIFAFGPFELDDATYELRRDGVPVPMQRRAFDFLLYLVRHDDVVCTQLHLRAHVWGGAVVTKDAIAHAAVAVRTALGDDGTYIRTVRGRGYRFAAPVEIRAAPRASEIGAPRRTGLGFAYERIARAALVI